MQYNYWVQYMSINNCLNLKQFFHLIINLPDGQNMKMKSLAFNFYIHTYTIHVVCVNFVREWWNLQFNVDSERQIFETFFHGSLFYSQSF